MSASMTGMPCPVCDCGHKSREKTAPQLLRAKDVAERLNVSASHAGNLLAQGVMATVRIGSSVRVTEAELARYIEANTHAAPRNRLRKINGGRGGAALG